MSKKDIEKENKIDTKKKKGKMETSDGLHIPRTVQESIPYIRVFENGMIEVEKGKYSKSYLLEDVNFQIASQEEQENMFLAYCDLLNTFGADVSLQVSIHNRNVDIEDFKKNILLKMQADNLNELREEYNKMVLDKMQEGRNNIVREKYLTLSITASSADEAISQFTRLDGQVSEAVKRISKNPVEPMTAVERLSILHDLYNPGKEDSFYRKAEINKKSVETFSFEHMTNMGLCTKDLIGPDSLDFNKDYIQIGDKYGRVLFIDNLPNFLTTNILTDFTDSPCNLLISIFYQSLAQDKALKLIQEQITNINSNVIDAQRKATQRGYSAELISPDLVRAQREASKILEDMTKRNQKLFLATLVLVHFADSLEQLNEDTKSITAIASKNLCNLRKLNYQQEAGLATVLPLANNKIFVKRMLTSESASVFIPYATQELSQANGMYYGLNAVSKNLILYNRINGKNANGVILGTPGAGKSFSAKREIVNVLLNTNDDVFILDPEREYVALADLLGGETIRIAAGSDVFINAMDMDIKYADDDKPVTLKSDFICSLCDTILGGRFGLTPLQKSIIDRCVKAVYVPYLAHMNEVRGNIAIDYDYMPTLQDFYELLLQQDEPEAQNIAISLEMYVLGSYNTFARKTTVKPTSRFVVYDIKDIGSSMKEMGVQVCLDHIWNKMISNFREGKRTWFYIDEFYLMTQTDSSAKFLQEIWKRARKWNGVPTGITQNVEDLLARQEARAIIQNSDFVLMLNQAPMDRQNLCSMLNISPSQEEYITNASPGSGLLYTGSTIVPFVDKFPKDTKLYKVMTTKPDEVNKR